MPIHAGIDNNGKHYYQWGSQKKYYYNIDSERSRALAYNKCLKQAKAIYSSKNKKQK